MDEKHLSINVGLRSIRPSGGRGRRGRVCHCGFSQNWAL